MGKVAILLVLCTGVLAAHGLASRVETGRQTAVHQADFEESVIAREIARSGFNVAMGIIRSHGDSLQAGVNAVNGAQGYLEGDHQGGVFRARAKYVSGHSVEVVSHGYYGGAFSQTGEYVGGEQHAMEDSYQYRVTSTPGKVKQCSLLKTEFLQSEAGYCSAVYLQRYLPDTDPADQPAPEMIFPPGNHRTGAGIPIQKTLAGGTQMNFFIAVSKDCEPYDDESWYKNDRWKTYDAESHVFDADDYDHIHYGFNAAVLGLEEIEETVWSMVEQHPSDNQRWRFAWEDQHKTAWDNPNSDDPATSLQALKAHGYDKDEESPWPDTDAWGYKTLRDYGSRPDFSDQVIDVSLTPLAKEECTNPHLVEAPEPEPDTTSTPAPEPAPEPDPAPEPAPEPEWDDTDVESSDPDLSQLPAACPCPGTTKQKHKVLVLHRPPGNPDNFQFICVSRNGSKAHLKNHDDHVICESGEDNSNKKDKK